MRTKPVIVALMALLVPATSFALEPVAPSAAAPNAPGVAAPSGLKPAPRVARPVAATARASAKAAAKLPAMATARTPAPADAPAKAAIAIAKPGAQTDTALRVNTSAAKTIAPYQMPLDVTGANVGNFNVPGLGAGHMVWTRERTHGVPDVVRFTADCDLMDVGTVQNVASANLVVVGANVSVPMEVMIDQRSATLGDRPYGEPRWPQRALQTGVPTSTVRSLMNGKDLNYYIEVKMKDGSVHYLNKDGQPFANFTMPSYALNDT